VLVTIVAVALAYACADSSRCNMHSRADPMPIKAAARTNRPDMRAGFHAAIANAGAGAHDRARVAASSNAVAIRARARANAADMGSRTHAMFADMCINANAQYFHIGADGICRDRCKERKSVK
jgi:hypothetical protein